MNLQDYFKLLDDNSAETINLVNDCKAAELHLQEQGKWSIMQVLEHVCIVEKRIGAMLMTPFENEAPSEEIIGKEALHEMIAVDTANKIVAPEQLHPKGEINDIETFKTVFVAQRNEIKSNLETGKIVVENKYKMHPRLGNMTISDWLYSIPFHNTRHLKQIRNIMASFKSAEASLA